MNPLHGGELRRREEDRYFILKMWGKAIALTFFWLLLVAVPVGMLYVVAHFAIKYW